MKQSPSLASSLIALALGSGLVASTSALAVPDAPQNWEKCTGISKAGMNDCGATDGAHKCASHAPEDGMATEWIYVPEGTCEKIVGGTVHAVKPVPVPAATEE